MKDYRNIVGLTAQAGRHAPREHKLWKRIVKRCVEAWRGWAGATQEEHQKLGVKLARVSWCAARLGRAIRSDHANIVTSGLALLQALDDLLAALDRNRGPGGGAAPVPA